MSYKVFITNNFESNAKINDGNHLKFSSISYFLYI